MIHIPHNLPVLSVQVSVFFFSILTRLCNHHHCITPEHFLHPEKKSASIPISSHSSLSALGNSETTCRLYGFAYSGHFIQMESHYMWPSVSGSCTWYNVSKVHPGCGMYQHFIPFKVFFILIVIKYIHHTI